MNAGGGARERLHASCVAYGRAGLLIVGPSGAGKSELALQMMAYGCVLVSDDQTRIEARDGVLMAQPSEAIRGRIEARGLGILAADTQAEAVVRAVVDLGKIETDRLPEPRSTRILGCSVPLLHKVESSGFSAALVQYLKGGRCI